MAYATQADLEERFTSAELARLTDDAMPAVTINAERVAAAIADAESLVNGYLAARYSTPLLPVPGTLLEKTCVIARYKLWKDRPSDAVRQAYEDAIGWLKDVSAGRVSLGTSGDTPTAPASSGAPVVVAPCRRFKNMRDF